jgi:hypothetical protein
VFEIDKQAADKITLGDWQRRPWREKVMEKLAGVLRSQV